MTHWAEKFIGMPWVNGAQGPDSFDCWGFVRHVYRVERGIDLPILEIDADKPLAIRHAIANEKTRTTWLPVDFTALDDFDVVLLSKAQHPDHVGVWTNGALLHCIRELGVCYQTRQSLYRSGWNIVSCYRRSVA
jgi:hypothetical protein